MCMYLSRETEREIQGIFEDTEGKENNSRFGAFRKAARGPVRLSGLPVETPSRKGLLTLRLNGSIPRDRN